MIAYSHEKARTLFTNIHAPLYSYILKSRKTNGISISFKTLNGSIGYTAGFSRKQYSKNLLASISGDLKYLEKSYSLSISISLLLHHFFKFDQINNLLLI